MPFRIRQGPDVGFQLRRFRFRLVISPSGEISLASDPSSQFVQPQRHGMVRPPEHALRFPDAPVQVVQGHLGLECPALGSCQLPGGILERRNHLVRENFLPSPPRDQLSNPKPQRRGVEQKTRIIPRLISGDSLRAQIQASMKWRVLLWRSYNRSAAPNSWCKPA